MDVLLHPSTITVVVHFVIVVAVAVRVIMLRPATGIALAWLLLVSIVPLRDGTGPCLSIGI